MAASKKQYRAKMRREHGADWHKARKAGLDIAEMTADEKRTYYDRVKYGWEPLEAATEAMTERLDRSLDQSREAIRRKYHE